MWAQVEFILTTQESLEGELPQSWFYSQRQGPLVSANPSITGYRLSQKKCYPPTPYSTTWKHSFYKPKAVLSQHGQLWAPSSQQCQSLGDWSTSSIKQIWAGNQEHLCRAWHNVVFLQLHHIFYLYWLSHLLKSISIFHTYCCSKLYTPFCFCTD